MRKVLANLKPNERLRLGLPVSQNDVGDKATNGETPRDHESQQFVELTDRVEYLTSPVLLTVTNFGFLDLLLNLLHSIHRLSNLQATILVVCEDRTAYTELLKKQSNFTLKYQLALTHLEESVINATDYRTQSYISLVQKRVSYVQLLLQRGLDVLYIDSDVVLLANPMKYFSDNKFDLFAQSEIESNRVLCAGFFYLRANEKTKRFVRTWKRDLAKDPRGIQVTFNRQIKLFRANMKVSILPINRFMSGKVFLKSEKPWFDRTPQPIEVHANFMVGEGRKEDMLKTHHLWFVED
ncbi:UDP-D-xylose:L-fucose alpha-1,3-D-xylosyltransferase 3 [Holothuria leucospilota]|uniref:UDP-D-xylose:L-fucose alpha-1,3-D-xylosyltransferase 3 n=1 Tax=Holothuria leucospilota TaxID=206669 RepID=A0A9Q1CM87_HOLLE|nr:UDP-D-xylose:L-fucose alpha-1,3-D-xylosyltransferase 3 [Holothuria leucospilota]